jgi:CheY-like chemotaxis protein
MYILLHGRLAVMTPEGMQVATLEPIATVCEMGFVIQQPRSAIVKAIQASNVLVIPKPPFDLLLQNDRELQARIYQNVTKILSSKLFKENVRIRDHLLEKTLFEKRLKEQRRRAEIALDLLVRKEVMTRDEAEMYISEELGDASLRVLIVDDEPTIRQMVKDMLSSYEVVEAADGEEALQMADEQALDLVITDIKMPKMDGFTLVTQLREQHPNLRVLGLSGYVEETDVREYDFDGFVKKPIALEEFRNLVAESLAK